MRRAGISSARRRAYRVTTNSNHVYAPAPNLLRRQFDIAEQNTAWVGDITYIPTGEGWLYAAVVKDLCTKKVVGYAFSNRIDTALTVSALEMAVRRERPAAGLIFHSDRGVQYAAQAYRDALARHNIRQSMSRRGDPYDNAVAENFFSCLKCELVYLSYFPTRAAAQAAVFAYIETFYNALRPHSAGFRQTPMQPHGQGALPEHRLRRSDNLFRNIAKHCDSFRFFKLFRVCFFEKGAPLRTYDCSALPGSFFPPPVLWPRLTSRNSLLLRVLSNMSTRPRLRDLPG